MSDFTSPMHVKCPYCGCLNTLRHDRSKFSQTQIFNCYSEKEQSCDKDFVVYSKLEVMARVAKIGEKQ